MTKGSRSYRCFDLWNSVLSVLRRLEKTYEEDFNEKERKQILSSLHKALQKLGTNRQIGAKQSKTGQPDNIFRTRSAGTLEEKKRVGSDYAKRKEIKAILDTYIRIFRSPRGSTSIDITKPGIDKAYESESCETSCTFR